jgi:hypothetical protein
LLLENRRAILSLTKEGLISWRRAARQQKSSAVKIRLSE